MILNNKPLVWINTSYKYYVSVNRYTIYTIFRYKLNIRIASKWVYWYLGLIPTIFPKIYIDLMHSINLFVNLEKVCCYIKYKHNSLWCQKLFRYKHNLKHSTDWRNVVLLSFPQSYSHGHIVPTHAVMICTISNSYWTIIIIEKYKDSYQYNAKCSGQENIFEVLNLLMHYTQTN